MDHMQIVLDEFNNLGRAAEAADSSTGGGGNFLGPVSHSEYDACVSVAQTFHGQADADVIHVCDVHVTNAGPGLYIARLTVVLTKEANKNVPK